MESAKISKKFLSCKSSKSLRLSEKNHSDDQKFYIYKSNDGYYKIRAVHTGNLLTGRYDAIPQLRNDNSDYQKWSFEKGEKGGVYIICKGNNLIMGLSGKSKIKLWPQNINKGQRFKLHLIKKFDSEKYTISTDKNKLQPDRMKTMFKALHKNWSIDKLKKIIKNSPMCFGVYDKKGNQIGFARIITDYMTTCFVMNVVIDKNHRGSGIGTKLMRHIVEHENLKDCQFSLVPSNRKVARTYGLVGFQKMKFTYMRIN